jgi:GntR family transcriptional regulator / MocR family aminotransferase
MAKRATAFGLVLPPRRSRIPVFRWLYASLRAEILEGRLGSGARLPATRDLARQYRLSRGTIVSAFELLKSEGYVRGTVGSGTYVSKILPDSFLRITRASGQSPSMQRKKRPRASDYAKRLNLFSGFEIRPSRAFRPNVPALDLFPTTLWAQIAARRLRRASMHLLLGCEPLGYRPLREVVASYLSTSRGVNCVPEQIAIVSGAQEALDLTARLI